MGVSRKFGFVFFSLSIHSYYSFLALARKQTKYAIACWVGVRHAKAKNSRLVLTPSFAAWAAPKATGLPVGAVKFIHVFLGGCTPRPLIPAMSHRDAPHAKTENS